MKNIKVIILLFSLAGVCFIGFTLLFARSMGAAQQEALPALGEAPRIELTSQENEAFDSNALAGKVWVTDFIFTACGGPCPVMTEAMAGVQQAFATEQRLNFVSISVDPDTDTPERLAEYGQKYGADFSRWHFLTGPIENIQKLAVDGFKIGSVDDPIIHSTRFILVDQAGQIRGYYMGIEPEDVEKMTKDIKQLLEARGA